VDDGLLGEHGGMQCESCGHDSDDLASVQRIYLVDAEAPGGPTTTTVLDDIEQWCFPCRSLYPHRLVVEGGLDEEDAPT
jgi:hypothetical protein